MKRKIFELYIPVKYYDEDNFFNCSFEKAKEQLDIIKTEVIKEVAEIAQKHKEAGVDSCYSDIYDYRIRLTTNYDSTYFRVEVIGLHMEREDEFEKRKQKYEIAEKKAKQTRMINTEKKKAATIKKELELLKKLKLKYEKNVV